VRCYSGSGWHLFGETRKHCRSRWVISGVHAFAREGCEKMTSKYLLWTPLLILIPSLFGRESLGETLRHGSLPGNTIPEGSQAICGGVPNDVALIENLRTGWAVDQPTGSGVRLVFSDRSLACADDEQASLLADTEKECASGWSFSLLLPPELLSPGSYELGEHVGFRNTITEAQPPGPGCGSSCNHGGTGGGTIPGGGTGLAATLEIYAVSDECITGRLSGLKTGQLAPPPPSWDGAFHAVRCTP
jgi:hypothetical protein